MAVKLWTVHFMRICAVNLLLFISLYILFPVPLIEVADRLGVPVVQAGVIFLSFTLRMLLTSPFHAYLVDAYKRKYVRIFSLTAVVAATVGHASVASIAGLVLLGTVQGLAFGIATTVEITLAINITNATLRSAGSVSFSWVVRLGMIIGIVLGVRLYQSYSSKDPLFTSAITGAADVLIVSGIYVPFRVPIVTKFYPSDRFLLLRGWVPTINIILTAFVLGLLISLVHRFPNDSVLESSGIPIPFLVGTDVRYLTSLLLVRLFILKEKTPWLVLVGIILEVVAIALLAPDFSVGVPSVLLDLGLGLVIPEFLVMFVRLSHHCQRGTANTTCLLVNEVGFASGIVVTYCFDSEADKMFYTGQMVAMIVLIFFTLVACSYYKGKKVR